MSSNLSIFTFQHLLQVLPFQQNPSCARNQATASDHPIYDIFARKKFFISKLFDDVIACNLVSYPPTKNPGSRL